MALIFKDGKFYQSDESGALKDYAGSNSGWTPQNRIDSPEETAYSALKENQSTAMPWTTDAQGNRVYGGNMNVNGQTIPVTGPTIPKTPTATATPATTQPTTIPTTATPTGTDPAVWSQYQQWLQSANTGSQEPYTASTAGGELGQATQNALLQNLNNAQYGYTPEEQALIRQQALDDYNKTLEQDTRNLSNIGEQLGWNQGLGQGGQSSSAFQDYFAKRATDQRGIETDLARQFSDRAAADKQNAITNALGGTQLFDTISRGEFADALAAAGFDLQTQQAQLAAYDNYQNTQNALASGVSERAYNQAQLFLAERGVNDTNSINLFAQLQDAYGVDAESVFNGLTQLSSVLTDAEIASMDAGDSQIMMAVMAALLMPDGGTGGLVGDVIDVFKDNTGNWLTRTTDGLYKIDPNTGGFVKIGEGDNTNTGGNTGTETTQVPGLSGFTKSGNQYYDSTGNSLGTFENDAAFYKYAYQNGAMSGAAYTKLTNPALFKVGEALAAYGLYQLGKNTLGSWYSSITGEGNKLTEDKAVYAAYNFIDSGDLTHANSALSVLSPWERLLSLNAIKNGSIEGLTPLTLDEQDAGRIQGWNWATDANIQKVLALAPQEGSDKSTWKTWLQRGYGNAIKTDNGYFNSQGFSTIYDYIPPISTDEFNESLALLVSNGTITQDEANQWKTEAVNAYGA